MKLSSTARQRVRYAIPFTAIFVLSLFAIDYGFNARIFVYRDFNAAFTARKTGNCERFRSYINPEYSDAWTYACYQEKEGGNPGIVSFEILSTQVNGNDAFLQVELTRSPNRNEAIKPYALNYQLQRVRRGLSSYWVINQDK